jgi:drug/metabolite transporter (DMT)-like permease
VTRSNGSGTAPRSPRDGILRTAHGTSRAPFRPRDWALLVAVGSIWGSSFLFIDIGMRSLAPTVVAMLRLLLGSATLALFPAARRTPVDRADHPRVALLGMSWVGIPMVLFPIAQQWIDSSVAGMINGAMPLATAAWSIALLRAWPPRTQVIGLVVGFLGIVAVTLPEVPLGASGDGGTALGVALAVIAILFYGLAAVLAVPLQQRYGAMPILLRSQGYAAILVIPIGLTGLGASTFSWPSLLAMVPLGTLGTAVAFVMMATLVGRVGGPRGSVAVYFVPVVAILLGVTILGERVAPIALAGTALVVAGAWMASRRDATPAAHPNSDAST